MVVMWSRIYWSKSAVRKDGLLFPSFPTLRCKLELTMSYCQTWSLAYLQDFHPDQPIPDFLRLHKMLDKKRFIQNRILVNVRAYPVQFEEYLKRALHHRPFDADKAADILNDIAETEAGLDPGEVSLLGQDYLEVALLKDFFGS